MNTDTQRMDWMDTHVTHLEMEKYEYRLLWVDDSGNRRASHSYPQELPTSMIRDVVDAAMKESKTT